MLNALGLVEKDGRVLVSSVDVAENFERKHKTVIRAIDNLKCDAEFNRHNFMPIKYNDPRNREQRAYLMTRDGFTLLVMGFTGYKAMDWKVKYIKAFNAMEAKLTERAARAEPLPAPDMPAVPQSFAEALQLAADLEKERATLAAHNQALEEAIEAQSKTIERTAPKATAWDEVCKAEGTHSVGEVAKVFGYQPNKLFGILREEGIFFKRDKFNYPMQQYLNNKSFTMIYVPKVIHGQSVNVPQIRVTSKGLETIRRIMAKRNILGTAA